MLRIGWIVRGVPNHGLPADAIHRRDVCESRIANGMLLNKLLIGVDRLQDERHVCFAEVSLIMADKLT